jgi:SAM-dependent methyltransferase
MKTNHISYPDEGNEACFKVEDQSFWFRHRNDCIVEVIRQFPPSRKGPIFDVGGGNGFVAKGLIDEGWEVVLVEPGQSGVSNAKKRGVDHVVCGTTHSAGFKNESISAIGVFDVVEHIEDDLGFLSHLCDLLEPKGMLYLSVPAYKFLWSREDIEAGHFRRYTLGQLQDILASTGFKLVFRTYIFGFLPLAVLLFRTLPYRAGLYVKAKEKISPQDHVIRKGIFSWLLAYYQRWELQRLKQNKCLPVGGSCLVVATKI